MTDKQSCELFSFSGGYIKSIFLFIRHDQNEDSYIYFVSFFYVYSAISPSIVDRFSKFLFLWKLYTVAVDSFLPSQVMKTGSEGY